MGIEVNHYDSLSNTNEELAFISSDKAYEVMKSELGQMMYVTCLLYTSDAADE